MSRHSLFILVAFLAGCGVETAGTAAVAGKAAEQEARAAEQRMEDIRGQLNTAAQLEQQRLDEAARQAGR